VFSIDVVLIFVSVDMGAFVSAIPYMAVSKFLSAWQAHQELLIDGGADFPGASTDTSINNLSHATMDLQKAVHDVCKSFRVLPQGVEWPDISNSVVPRSAEDIIAVQKWLKIHMNLPDSDPDPRNNSKQKVDLYVVVGHFRT
jgi:hypothetical protein